MYTYIMLKSKKPIIIICKSIEDQFLYIYICVNNSNRQISTDLISFHEIIYKNYQKQNKNEWKDIENI